LVLLPSNRKLEQDKTYTFLQENLRSVHPICAVSCGLVGNPAVSNFSKPSSGKQQTALQRSVTVCSVYCYFHWERSNQYIFNRRAQIQGHSLRLTGY